MCAFQESQEVNKLIVEWLLKDSIYHSVERIDKIFFFDVETGTGADFDDLKWAKKTSHYIFDAEFWAFRCFQFTKQVLSQDIN